MGSLQIGICSGKNSKKNREKFCENRQHFTTFYVKVINYVIS